MHLAAGLLVTSLIAPQVDAQQRASPDTVVPPGDAVNRYEERYGPPEFRDLDDWEHGPSEWPSHRSIRTEGHLHYLSRDDEGKRSDIFLVQGSRHNLTLQPAEELLDVWATHLPFWNMKRVEVVGAFDPDVTPKRFLVWQISLIPEREEGEDAPRATLEELVVDPEAHRGRRVTVVGTFRGANLFDDMPGESRRHPGDWVLRDGPFFVWVTSRPPKGLTFSLDSTSRADCRYRLEVVGWVETEEGFIYLDAETLRLLGRAREDR